MRSGIAVGGNMIVDVLKTISTFPERHGLVKIESVSRALGGAVNNVVRDLARLDPELPLWAVGLVGKDGEGQAVMDELSSYPNINLSQVGFADRTSFTDVLTERESRARTFLVYPGASSLLDVGHFDFDKLPCKMLHMGYILLLETLDSPDAEYGTRMARLLHDAQSRGIVTSVDVVSEVGDRYKTLVPPALRYTDYLVINEIEAGKTCGMTLRRADDTLDREAVRAALYALKDMGVARWTVIHAPEGGYGVDEKGAYREASSLRLPDGFIRGTVGAGDAFCAGVLLDAYRDAPLDLALSDGVIAAACSLRADGASEGVCALDEARRIAEDIRRG